MSIMQSMEILLTVELVASADTFWGGCDGTTIIANAHHSQLINKSWKVFNSQ